MKQQTLQRLSVQKGFSLVELMVAVVILGILFAVAVPSLAGAIDRARLAQVKQNYSTFKNVIESYNLEKGEYPAFMQELDQAPFNTELAKLENPFYLTGPPDKGLIGTQTFRWMHKDGSGNPDLGRGSMVIQIARTVTEGYTFLVAGSTSRFLQGAIIYFPFTTASGGDSVWAGGGFNSGSLAAALAAKEQVLGYVLGALDGGGAPIKELVIFEGENVQCSSCI